MFSSSIFVIHKKYNDLNSELHKKKKLNSLYTSNYTHKTLKLK